MLLERALNTLTWVAWAALVGFVVILFVRTAQGEGIGAAVRRVFSERMLAFLLAGAILITFLSNAIVFIEPQQVGVVISLFSPRGYRERPLQPGLNLIVPLFEQVYRMPIFWQTYTMSNNPLEGQRGTDDSIAARTQDGQLVFIDVSLIYSIDPEQAVKVYIGWQERYQDDLIRPLLRSIVRTQVSQYRADEIISSQRLDLERDLSAQVRIPLADHGFLMDRFLLRNIGFSPQYSAAVEEKQVAEQGAIRDQYRAEQARLLAQGEADALELLGQALVKNPDVATLRYIDKLSPSITTLLLPNNVPFILPLPTVFSRQGAIPGEAVTPLPVTPVSATATAIATPTPALTATPTPTPTP